MTLTVNLTPEQEQRVLTTARLRGVAPADIVRELLDTIPQPAVDTRSFAETATAQEWNAAFLEWTRAPRPDAPPLSEDAVSRASIYEERD